MRNVLDRVRSVPSLELLGWALVLLRLAILDPLEIARSHSVNDYGSFHFAAVAVAHGDDPYTNMSRYAAEEGSGAHPYLYPPFLAYALVPFSLLPLWPARLLWEAVSVGAAVGSLLLIRRRLGERPGESEKTKAAAMLIAGIFWPLRESAWSGQVNAIVLLLILLWWTLRERTPFSGAWLGVAMAIKMSPTLLCLFIMMERKWKEVFVAAGVAAACVALSCLAMGSEALVFPKLVLSGFLPGHAYHAFTVAIHSFGNESLAALVIALFGNPGGDAFRLGSLAAFVQMALVVFMLSMWGMAARHISRDRALSSLMIVMILAPTYAWEHHLLFALLAVMVLAAENLAEKRSAKTLMTWVLVAWLCEPHTAMLLPSTWELPRALRGLSAMPKIVPLLGVFWLLIEDGLPWREGQREGESALTRV
jgi:hypothetical protein